MLTDSRHRLRLNIRIDMPMADQGARRQPDSGNRIQEGLLFISKYREGIPKVILVVDAL